MLAVLIGALFVAWLAVFLVHCFNDWTVLEFLWGGARENEPLPLSLDQANAKDIFHHLKNIK